MRRPLRSPTFFLPGWLTVLFVLVSCAGRQDAAREQMQELQRLALADAKNGQTAGARRRLLAATRVGQEAGLEYDPAMARAQMALGALYAQGFRDDRRAVAYMTRALTTTPELKLPAALAAPRSRRALATARARVAKGPPDPPRAKAQPAPPRPPPTPPPAATAAHPAAPPPPGEPRAVASRTRGRGRRAGAPVAPVVPAPPPVVAAPAPPPSHPPAATAPPPASPPPAAPAVAAKPAALPPPTFPEGQSDPLYCPIPLEAPPSHEVVLRCAVRPDLRPGRLMLHYRPAGTEQFTTVAMPRARRGHFQGIVPADATAGKSLQFFVEAGGPTRINAGSADSPNILLIREGATPVGQRAPEDPVGEAKVAEDEAAAEAERIRREDEDPLAASELKRELALVRRRPGGKLWVALGIGSGYGWQPGSDLEFRPNRRIDSGPLAAGLAHALPEIGYQVTDDLALSIQGRFQYAPVEGSGDPLPGNPRQSATAYLLRGTLNLGEGPLHTFASACVGGAPGGGFRLVVPASREMELPRSDTVRGGPFLIGGGAGLVYHFSRRIAWPLEARVLAGLPSLAAVVELGTGVAVAF